MNELLRILAEWKPAREGRIMGVEIVEADGIISLNLRIDFDGIGPADSRDNRFTVPFLEQGEPAAIRGFIHDDLDQQIERLFSSRLMTSTRPS